MFAFNDSHYSNPLAETTLSSLENRPLKCLSFFLIGFLGIIIVPFLLSLALGGHLANASEGEYLTLVNLLTYAILFVAMALNVAITPAFYKNLRHHRCDKWTTVLLLSVIALFASNVFSNVYSIILGLFDLGGSNDNQQIIEALTGGAPLMMFFATVVLGPAVEELAYRVGLAGALARWNKIGAVLISALVFGLIHFSFTGDLLTEILNIPLYLAPGLVFGYLYVRTESIWPSYILHTLNNLIGFLVIIAA